MGGVPGCRDDGSERVLPEAAADLAAPEWPDLTFAEILRLAFKQRVIDSYDHPFLKQLRGEA